MRRGQNKGAGAIAIVIILALVVIVVASLLIDTKTFPPIFGGEIEYGYQDGQEIQTNSGLSIILYQPDTNKPLAFGDDPDSEPMDVMIGSNVYQNVGTISFAWEVDNIGSSDLYCYNKHEDTSVSGLGDMEICPTTAEDGLCYIMNVEPSEAQPSCNLPEGAPPKQIRTLHMNSETLLTNPGHPGIDWMPIPAHFTVYGAVPPNDELTQTETYDEPTLLQVKFYQPPLGGSYILDQIVSAIGMQEQSPIQVSILPSGEITMQEGVYISTFLFNGMGLVSYQSFLTTWDNKIISTPPDGYIKTEVRIESIGNPQTCTNEFTYDECNTPLHCCADRHEGAGTQCLLVSDNQCTQPESMCNNDPTNTYCNTCGQCDMKGNEFSSCYGVCYGTEGTCDDACGGQNYCTESVTGDDAKCGFTQQCYDSTGSNPMGDPYWYESGQTALYDATVYGCITDTLGYGNPVWWEDIIPRCISEGGTWDPTPGPPGPHGTCWCTAGSWDQVLGRCV